MARLTAGQLSSLPMRATFESPGWNREVPSTGGQESLPHVKRPAGTVPGAPGSAPVPDSDSTLAGLSVNLNKHLP